MANGRAEQRDEAMARIRAALQRHVTGLRYRLRPEHAAEGLEYIPISAEASQPYFPSGKPLEIAVWNTFKGKRERYYDVLSAHTQNSELILLQEFKHDPVLETYHRDIFAGRDAGMAVSFYTQPNQASPTGVCTVSQVRSAKTIFLLSRYLEPVTRTPKMAICTYYPIDCADCVPGKSLLVLNSHGINFRLRRPFLDQMLQFEAHLRSHEGPIILVGDFNTWEQGRVRILEAVTRGIGLQHVPFPRGIKTVRGHALDRVYVRGGTAADQRVIVDHDASDHSMLSFRFTLER